MVATSGNRDVRFDDFHGWDRNNWWAEKGENYVNKILVVVYEAEQRAMERTQKEFSPEFVEAIDQFSDYLYEEFEKIYQRDLEELLKKRLITEKEYNIFMEVYPHHTACFISYTSKYVEDVDLKTYSKNNIFGVL